MVSTHVVNLQKNPVISAYNCWQKVLKTITNNLKVEGKFIISKQNENSPNVRKKVLFLFSALRDF
jgi:hypothetical protein